MPQMSNTKCKLRITILISRTHDSNEKLSPLMRNGELQARSIFFQRSREVDLHFFYCLIIECTLTSPYVLARIPCPWAVREKKRILAEWIGFCATRSLSNGVYLVRLRLIPFVQITQYTGLQWLLSCIKIILIYCETRKNHDKTCRSKILALI